MPSDHCDRQPDKSYRPINLVDQKLAQSSSSLLIDVALGTQTVPDPGAHTIHNVHSLVGVGSQILRQLGVGRMRLMGPPARYNAISGFGLEVVEYLSY